MTTLTYEDYTVGWICAIRIEETAAKAMLDEVHEPLPQRRNDTNIYILGRIGKHNVAISCLPARKVGTHSAAITATNMIRTFPFFRFCLMVGVGGGVPSDTKGIKLGDVVVSVPRPKNNAVVQYDYGQTNAKGDFVRTHSLNAPPRILLNAVNRVRAEHDFGKYGYLDHIASVTETMRPTFSSPDSARDPVFDADYNSVDAGPHIFYGTIATGNQVMTHGETRDKIARDIEALCFEMEAGGLMDDFRCLVIRGICDNSDANKNKSWQGRAALAAAAYAKELLSFIEPEEGKKTSLISPSLTAHTIGIPASSTSSSESLSSEHPLTQTSAATTSVAELSSDSFFVLNRQILQLNSVALGRLIINTRAPWEDYCPDIVSPAEKDIGISIQPRLREILQTAKGIPACESLVTTLSNLLQKLDIFLVINSTLSAEKTYHLLNSAVWFEKVCMEPKVRKWFENVIKYGFETYMIVGLHTVCLVPTRGIVAENKVAQAGDPAIGGEVIVAVQYRKVQFSWFWQRSVDSAFLKFSNVWEPVLIIKGSEEEEDTEVVQATLQTTVTEGDFKDEGEVHTLSGQVIVL